MTAITLKLGGAPSHGNEKLFFVLCVMFCYVAVFKARRVMCLKVLRLPRYVPFCFKKFFSEQTGITLIVHVGSSGDVLSWVLLAI